MTQFTIVVVYSTEQVNPTALSKVELLLDEFIANCHIHGTEHTVAVQFKMATRSSVRGVESHSIELTFVFAPCSNTLFPRYEYNIITIISTWPLVIVDSINIVPSSNANILTQPVWYIDER